MLTRFLVIYIIWSIGGTFAYFIQVGDGECAATFYGPIYKWLYNTTEMNVVGCVLTALLYYFLFPVLIPIKLAELVYLLMHIGRKF